MMTAKTLLEFKMDIREAQSLLKLLRMVDDLRRLRGGILSLHDLNDGNRQDFTAIRMELENILLMRGETK